MTDLPSGGTGPGEEIEVAHEPEATRFVIRLTGRLVGRAEYASGPGGARVFTHTEVDPAYEGRGLASRLMAGALAATREEGLRVVAECPFVVAYVRRHADDYRDLVISPPL